MTSPNSNRHRAMSSSTFYPIASIVALCCLLGCAEHRPELRCPYAELPVEESAYIQTFTAVEETRMSDADLSDSFSWDGERAIAAVEGEIEQITHLRRDGLQAVGFAGHYCLGNLEVAGRVMPDSGGFIIAQGTSITYQSP